MPPAYTDGFICGSLNGCIVTGGQDHNVAKNEVYQYEAETGLFRSLPPMSIARSSHSAVYHDGALYVAGGKNNDGYLTSVEKFDFKQRKWTSLPNLPYALRQPYFAVVGDRLYLLGGWQDEINSIYQIHILMNNVWTHNSNLAYQCKNGACIAINDDIYVLGGEEPRLMKYSPTQNACNILTFPQFAHKSCAAAEWNGKIILFGGENTDAIEEYDPVTNQWSLWDIKMPAQGVFRSAFKMVKQ
jgi:hypothetical protein